MGVKGLEFYIENFFTQGRRKVSIIEMANRCREVQYIGISGTQKRVPILAVDGMAVLRRLYKMDDLEWLYGGQWKQYVENFHTFVKRFQEEQIELVFFFDDKTERLTENEWIIKRTKKLKDIQDIFNHILLFNSYPDDHLSQLPTALDTLIQFALRNVCKCTVHNVLNAEQEVAKYAISTPNCFAILSQNSNYMVYDTKPYLSVAHLKLGKLETVQYERAEFAQHLGMTLCQLPLFACLRGNRIISSETLEKFHCQLNISSSNNYNPQVLIHRLAEFVCLMGWTGNLNDKAKIIHISKLAGLSPIVLSNGLEFYSLVRVKDVAFQELPYCSLYTKDKLNEKLW